MRKRVHVFFNVTRVETVFDGICWVTYRVPSLEKPLRVHVPVESLTHDRRCVEFDTVVRGRVGNFYKIEIPGYRLEYICADAVDFRNGKKGVPEHGIVPGQVYDLKGTRYAAIQDPSGQKYLVSMADGRHWPAHEHNLVDAVLLLDV